MKLPNKLQTLLTDLLDTKLRRQWHVTCRECSWEVHNLDHERFAVARGKAHSANAHPGIHQSLDHARFLGYQMAPLYRVYYSQSHEIKWCTRA